MISSGELKFVLLGGGGNRGANSNTEIQSWVSSNCTIDSAAPAQIYLCSASN
jgi:hypothetical protein